VLNATAASDIFTQDIEDAPPFTATVVPNEPAPEEVAKVVPEQIEAIHVALAKNNVEVAELLKFADITDVRELSAEDGSKAVKWIEAQGKKAMQKAGRA
jgi:hypothetical protein